MLIFHGKINLKKYFLKYYFRNEAEAKNLRQCQYKTFDDKVRFVENSSKYRHENVRKALEKLERLCNGSDSISYNSEPVRNFFENLKHFLKFDFVKK